jgi:hypothetical protein
MTFLSRCFLWLAIFLSPVISQAAGIAQARMYCFSPRFQQSDDQIGFFTLALTTLSFGINGELAFGDFFGTGASHSTFLTLTDEVFGDEYAGAMALDVPDGGDANENGYPDFFEVAQAVNATSSGVYDIDSFGNGLVSASWSRAAGSPLGVCVLTFQNSSFGNLVFSPAFQLLEYTGPLTYNPGSNTVSGTVNLTQTGNSTSEMQGPVQFEKVSTNRFNLLVLQPGAWSNSAMQTLTFTNDLFFRDSDWPTNYGGYFDFQDWDPNTPDPDYVVWGLSIDDTNDVNHNAIPDFSDDPQSALPRRPLLSLTLTSSNVLLTIHGDVGHLHQVQETLALPTTNWQTVASITLTNDPQSVSLPPSAAGTRLWRVLAQ